MNLSISTACFYPQLYTEDTIEKIADLGIDTMEVFLQTGSEYKDRYINELALKIRKKGLQVYSVHASSASFEPLLFSDYKREVDDSLEVFKDIFNCCKTLGAKYYVFHGPRLMTSNVNQWPMIIDRMKKLIDLAQQYGVAITQENVSWCVSSKIEFIQYLNEQKLDNLFYTLDNKQAVKSHVDSIELAKIMSTKLVNVHISDFRKIEMGIFPGHGQYNFPGLINTLKELNYSGPVCVEVYGKYLPTDLTGEFKAFKKKYF